MLTLLCLSLIATSQGDQECGAAQDQSAPSLLQARRSQKTGEVKQGLGMTDVEGPGKEFDEYTREKEQDVVRKKKELLSNLAYLDSCIKKSDNMGKDCKYPESYFDLLHLCTDGKQMKSVEMHHESVDQAIPGDNVDFNVKILSVKNIKRGYVSSDKKNDDDGKSLFDCKFLNELFACPKDPFGKIGNGKIANINFGKFENIISKLGNGEPGKRPVLKPLRLPLQDVYKISGIGTVPVGRVETGIVKAPFSPEDVKYKIGGIGTVPVGRVETGIVKAPFSPEDVQKCYCSILNDEFTAPEKCQHLIEACYRNANTPECFEFSVKMAFTRVPKAGEIVVGLDKRTGKVTEEFPKHIKSGDAAMVNLIPVKPMVVEAFSEYPPLGRFAVRDMKQTVAVGVIKETPRKERKGKKGGKK